MSGMSLDEFLGHKSSSRDGGKILNWKKRKPPVITTWLHTGAPIIALWRHGWPRIVEIERDGVKQREVWGGNFNCHEHEDVLRRQYKRGPRGERLDPPKSCPMCLLIEYLHTEVDEGRLSWVEPVFKFEADDDRETQVLTAGGLYNAFGGELSRDDIAELRRAGIRRDEAWKQNGMAKCSYVFSVVDHDEPSAGVQVCVETTGLGDAVKQVIRNQMDSLGETEGHPLRSPYAIRWEYHPDEKEFSKKYRALAMPKIAMTPEVHDLIVDSAAPNIASLIERGNVAALRAVMEAHALIDLPFDRIFAAAEGGTAQAPAARRSPAPGRIGVDEAARFREQAEGPVPTPVRNGAARPGSRPADPDEPRTVNAPREEPARPARTRAAAKPAGPKMPDYPKGTVLIPCDSCGAQMADTDEECWKCGAKYEIEGEVAPPPAPVKSTAKPAPVSGDPGDDVPW